MSYDVDELFRFAETARGYTVAEYLKKDDPGVTEVEIPEEYNDKPVTLIYGFHYSNYLKSVKLPKGLNEIGGSAFEYCTELERVELNSAPYIGLFAFSNCPKLPAETVVMGLVHSTDLTRPISEIDEGNIVANPDFHGDIYRPDVFELLAKNNCLRDIDTDVILAFALNIAPEIIPIAEQYGLLNEWILNRLISLAVKGKKVECTAYLLDLKNRKFGFKKDGDLNL